MWSHHEGRALPTGKSWKGISDAQFLGGVLLGYTHWKSILGDLEFLVMTVVPDTKPNQILLL